MKKIILLLSLLFLVPFLGYSQINVNGKEGFENGIPSDWKVLDNGVGTAQSWGITTTTSEVHGGLQAARMLRENIGQSKISEDWLITSSVTLPANPELHFYSRANFTGDQGTIYKIMISPKDAPSPTTYADLESYSEIRSFTELELSSNSQVYEEKIVQLGQFPLENRIIAFVRVFKQPTSTLSGDIWLIDDINIASQCIGPDVLGANAITARTAQLTWNNPGGATSFDVEYGISGFAIGTGTIVSNITTTSVDVTNLLPETKYDFYVKAYCSSGMSSIYIGAYTFKTLRLGLTCSYPIIVDQLPYQVANENTANFADLVDNLQIGATCGASPTTTNYMAGNDAFYSYTSANGGTISITMTPLASSTNSSLFVYDSCSKLGVSCLGGMANALSNTPRVVTLTLTQGQTIIIAVSSSAATQTIQYSLVIQDEICTPKPTGLGVQNQQLTTAELFWTDNHSAWQVVVEPLSSALIPSNGDTVSGTSSNPYLVTDLISGTQYQYWVRAECAPSSNTYTAWAGPFLFNTLTCLPADKCIHKFRMTDSANNGWNGATMQIRQSGIVLATIGSTYTSGAGPVDVDVALCKDLPFEIYWDKPGAFPIQCIVTVINSFGQTIYTMPAGDDLSGKVFYTSIVNCTTPLCNIPPSNLIAVPSTHSAILSWGAPATSMWDIYLVPKGSNIPDPNSLPTYVGVISNPFNTNESLLADTDYDFYVRVHCDSSDPSPWSPKGTFHTYPTCPKPTGLYVDLTKVTQTSAELTWIPGGPSDNQWDVLLVPSTTTSLPAQLPPADAISNPAYLSYHIPDGKGTIASPLNVTNLSPATIYFYYVRTICDGGNDIGVWAGPYVFNTVTCDPLTKCTYKFIMTDSGSNGWQNGRMQIRQNGIVVQTIGSTISGSGPTTMSVGLCPDVPFDIYWSVAGTAPNEIGLTVQNPFTDVIYTKPAGSGSPLNVLFQSTGNCTPPSCPKPTGLTVVNLTTNSATLKWTESGTAIEWEVYAVPLSGAVTPVNGSPLHENVPNYYKATTNPFTINGLSPSTSYIYYVRAICSPTDLSTWTILNPYKFNTKPVNDECNAAISIPVNLTRICEQKVSGNTLGATGSLPLTSPVCSGTTDDDIWYSFIATAPTHIITLSDIVGLTTDLNHTVYSGQDCAALTQLYCSNPNVSVATKLTPGQEYKIRVYTNGSVVGQSATFSICITTPEPITNDECVNATPIEPNNGLICNISMKGSLTGATASVQPSTCIGYEDDDVWFSFVAKTATHYLTLEDIVGTTIDLNHSVYSGSCDNLKQIYCSQSNSLMSNYALFIPGQTYYVRVWSGSSVLQDVTFKLCIGSVMPPLVTNTSKYTPAQLIEDVLLNTKCASVTNVTYKTGTQFGSVNGIGYFDGSKSEFPFKNGIVLSTGNALSVPGPNAWILNQGSGNWTGDYDLEQIIYKQLNYIMHSYNATVLEFDFVPLANKISFNFLFASEEYGIFQCEYSDSFAFLLTDKSNPLSVKNLAVLPSDPSIPVSVISIRDKMFNNGCDSQHPEYFDHYYFPPYPPGVNSVGAPINFNGVTIPMVANSDVIADGRTYHIKMVIADRGDTNYDSAVFLEGGSFNIGHVDLGADLTGTTAVCPGYKTTIVSSLDPAQYNFNWTKDGSTTPIPNEHGPNLEVSEPGVYTVNAQFGVSPCFATDSIKVDYYQEPTLGKANNIFYCGSENTAVFDLTQNTPLVLAPYINDTNVTHTLAYFTSQSDADNNINEIENLNHFTNSSNPQTIYVRVSNNFISCYQVTTFQVGLQDLSPKYTLGGAMSFCPQGSTTITVLPTDNDFDLNSAVFSWKFNETVVGTGKSLTINTSAGYGTYEVSVTANGCTVTQQFEITNSNTVWDITLTAPATLCPLQTGTISATIANNTNNALAYYTYSLPNSTAIGPITNNSITIDQVGSYSVMVDILGCQTTKSIEVIPNTSTFSIAILSGCDNNDYKLLANPVSGSFDPATVSYVWGGPDFSTVTNAPNTIILNKEGVYSVRVTDAMGCFSDESIEVSNILCTVQKGLSLNGDGKNDNLVLNDAKKLEIFNRYGMKVYSLSNYTNQWHGQTDDGKDLPDGTYYYVVERATGEILTGWIYITR